jgi:gluconokinase
MHSAEPVPAHWALPPAIVLMGVSGSGKTAVGRHLSTELGLPFRDGDEFHPPANVAKMSSGVPLTDDDRWPWLDAIGKAIGEASRADRGIIVGCSALKRAYREHIIAAAGRPVLFVFLDGTRETLKRRLEGRKGHFMPPSLLDSQLATLEPPAREEGAIRISVEPPLDQVVADILAKLAGQAATRWPSPTSASRTRSTT